MREAEKAEARREARRWVVISPARVQSVIWFFSRGACETAALRLACASVGFPVPSGGCCCVSRVAIFPISHSAPTLYTTFVLHVLLLRAGRWVAARWVTAWDGGGGRSILRADSLTDTLRAGSLGHWEGWGRLTRTLPVRTQSIPV